MIEPYSKPQIKNFNEVSLPIPVKSVLKNGIELQYINKGDQEAFKIDVILPGGKCDEEKVFVSSMAAAMLNKGTANMDAKQIADALDFNGAWFQFASEENFTILTLYSINRCAAKSIAILEQLIKHPSFPEDKLEVVKTRLCESLRNNNKVGKYLAVEKFAYDYYGENHPLGRKKSIDGVESITRADLNRFHATYYVSKGVKIFLSGCITDSIIALVSDVFGSAEWGIGEGKMAKDVKCNYKCINEFAIVNKCDALQSSILFTIDAPLRNSEDYIPFRFLTILLGGFFGSRLMKNIREDKGYTYGINANLFGKSGHSYMQIMTECATDYTYNLIAEVKAEFTRLINEEVSAEELEILKSYILSSLVNKSENAFSIAQFYISLEIINADKEYFANQVSLIKTIDGKTLQAMAKKYLNPDEMMIVIAGDENKLKKINN